MAISRVSEIVGANRRFSSKAGTVSRIRLENFMCHSNLEIELSDYVNFITGQNGSGKSAILTALCVAFGCRARSTQRASTLKDFIKTGCHYAVVVVQIKNQGEDAFRHEIYGDAIIIERRISVSASVITIKDNLGRKVATGKEKLHELVEHFNIDVENPCVIMTQDKSREFLHSGNSKDKFQFFYKATLLQVVDDLLKRIRTGVESANGLVAEQERSMEPLIKELSELERKIESLEQVERILEQVTQLRKQLAWALVYDDDMKLQEQGAKVEKSKKNKLQCEARITKSAKILEELRDCYLKKKAGSQHLLERPAEVTKMKKDELYGQLREATIEKRHLEDEHGSKKVTIEELKNKLKKLEKHVLDTQDQYIKETQAEVNVMEENLKTLEDEINEVTSLQKRLSEEENSLLEAARNKENDISEIRGKIEGKRRKLQEISTTIHKFEKSQTNKVNAFGGDKVCQLLQVLESHHHKFKQPPIGPIGAHLNLVNNDYWAASVEYAVGGLFNAFIVTDYKDSLLLRSCAQEAKYDKLTILIYDFSRPRIDIPLKMLPQTSHPTVLSVLHSENPTVMNVLVDMGSIERQVLVMNYDVGKGVAFDKTNPNLKEVYTKDGYKLFFRGSVDTILPPTKWFGKSRLCSSYADQIEELKKEHAAMDEQIQHDQQRKRTAEGDLNDMQEEKETIKKRRLDLEKDLSSKKLDCQGLKDSSQNTSIPDPVSSVDEVNEEISIVRSDIQCQEIMLGNILEQIEEVGAQVGHFKESFEKLCESAQAEMEAMTQVHQELEQIQDQIKEAEKRKTHYEKLLAEKVKRSIEAEQAEYEKLEKKREEDFEKATQICPESEVKAVGGWEDRTPEQLENQINRLNQRSQPKILNSSESLDDLRSIYKDKQDKIQRKQRNIEGFRQKLSAIEKAVNLRQKKFERFASLLRQQLTWQFNSHLGRKGITGKIEVDYKQKTLFIEVTMPHDGSINSVRDTRGLSGGERSFSTLCFALTLHAMTDAPFRAMDEFDVFMDAVSRKISLDALVEFALEQECQWIFITPHDISMVQQGDRVRKQEMAAPRS